MKTDKNGATGINFTTVVKTAMKLMPAVKFSCFCHVNTHGCSEMAKVKWKQAICACVNFFTIVLSILDNFVDTEQLKALK